MGSIAGIVALRIVASMESWRGSRQNTGSVAIDPRNRLYSRKL